MTATASPAIGSVQLVTEPAVPWLSLLQPSMAGGHLQSASNGAQFSRVVRAVGVDAAHWAVEIGQQAAERVTAQIPGHVSDGGFDVLRMGTESTTMQLLMTLAGDELDAPVTSDSLGGIPEFVRRGVSLDELLRGIQLGHSVIAAAFLAECARLGDAGHRHEQMRTLSQQTFAFFDAFSTQMATSYREEQIRWTQSEAASRLTIVQELVRGHDQPLEVTSRHLRYDLTRTHLALVVWSSARTLDADQDALHEAACELLRQAGCQQKLVLSVSLGVVWAWATPKADGKELGKRLAAATLPADVHAVFGAPGRGVGGFRTSHEDAQAAFTLRSQKPGDQAVTPYGDLDLLSLLLADPDRALRFARRELGELSAYEPNVVELRRTLAVYLEEGGSPQGAAQRLKISRNTVSYRVRRAEEILGRGLGVRRQHLQAALVILEECLREPPAKA